MNHRQPEQLNNAQFPAESEPEYTLEEIMAEFGAPQEPEPIPEPVPEPDVLFAPACHFYKWGNRTMLVIVRTSMVC